jgi:hypothetical protein
MSLEKIVVISSSDKEDSSQSNSDFVVALQEKYYTQGVNKIQVKEISLPNVFYNIRGSGTLRNNRLLINEDGIYVPFTIPEGQYVISDLGTPPANDLLTTIENLVNPVVALNGASVSLDFDAVSQKVIWNWTFGGVPYGFVPKSEGNLMADVLGIAEGDESQVGNTTQTPSYTPALNGYNMVYVQSKDLGESNGIDGDFGLIPLVESVSLHDSPFGSYAYKQSNDSELAEVRYENPRNLNRINITLRDVEGNKLDIGTNTMTITFKIYLSTN